MSREDMGKEFAWSILAPAGYNVLNCSYRTSWHRDIISIFQVFFEDIEKKARSSNSGWRILSNNQTITQKSKV